MEPPRDPTSVPIPVSIALVAHARTVPSEAREAFGDAAAGHRARPAGDPPPHLPPRGAVRGESIPAARPLAAARACRTAAVRLEGTAAARHVFSVAAGLDSVVVGEDQILHQLRECLSDRHLPAAGGVPGRRRVARAAAATGPPPAPRAPVPARAPPRPGDALLARGPARARWATSRSTGSSRSRARSSAGGSSSWAPGAWPACARSPRPGRAPGCWSRTGAAIGRPRSPTTPNGEPAAVRPRRAAARRPTPSSSRSRRAGRSRPARARSSSPAASPWWTSRRRPRLDADLREALGRALHVGRRPRPEPAGRAAQAAPSAGSSGSSTRPSRTSHTGSAPATASPRSRRSASTPRRGAPRSWTACSGASTSPTTSGSWSIQMSHRLVAGLLHAPLVDAARGRTGELERAARTLFSL